MAVIIIYRSSGAAAPRKVIVYCGRGDRCDSCTFVRCMEGNQIRGREHGLDALSVTNKCYDRSQPTMSKL